MYLVSWDVSYGMSHMGCLILYIYLMKDCTGARNGELVDSQNNFSQVQQRRRPTLLHHPVPVPHTDGTAHTYVTHWNTSRHLQYATSQSHVTDP